MHKGMGKINLQIYAAANGWLYWLSTNGWTWLSANAETIPMHCTGHGIDQFADTYCRQLLALLAVRQRLDWVVRQSLDWFVRQ